MKGLLATVAAQQPVGHANRGQYVNRPQSSLGLARRLRALREEHWPDRRTITQAQLAQALGKVSVSLISSWESTSDPRIPPLARLNAYALLFASPRSFDSDPPAPLNPADLNDEERHVMGALQLELRQLRNEALQARLAVRHALPPPTESPRADPWRFTDGEPITLVCAEMPQEMLNRIPYTNADDPDYVELLRYADLDALFELHGHLRAANPASTVNLRPSKQLSPADHHSHLILIGGVDWNTITTWSLDKLRLPVRQVADWGTDKGPYFEVADESKTSQYYPMLDKTQEKTLLLEDVALFARAPSPFDRSRTISICNGMYGRGTYGAVRALTDDGIRERNFRYLRSRIGDHDSYCVLTRISVIEGKALTPDWELGDDILFFWSR
jgi:transcriptional regulator with XRE-family HTH domain